MGEIRMAACGVDCAACASYKVTMRQDIRAAEAMVGWYRGQGWIGKDEGAEAIIQKNPLCKGCWDATADCFFKCGCHPGRDFRICCTEKQIAHCGQCDVFPCDFYVEFVGDLEHHKIAMARLYALREAREGTDSADA